MARGAPAGRFSIPFTSEDFPHGVVAATGYLSADWNDLLWAALTVGRPNTAYVFRHGDASYHEALFRLSLVRMALEERPLSTHLHRTAAFRALDPTEKGAVSYFLGMAVCKLFADRLLSTTWLRHLDAFRGQLDPVVLGGRSRPDLVGSDNSGAWHAFECKGRSGVPNVDEQRKAKKQAERLVRVGSTNCGLHVGAISYFRRNRLEFHWRDPEPEEAAALAPLELTLPGDAWGHYYRPAVALYSVEDNSALAGDGDALDLNVEFHPEILEPLMLGEWVAARSLALERRVALQRDGFRPDGLKVTAGASWARERTAQRFDQ